MLWMCLHASVEVISITLKDILLVMGLNSMDYLEFLNSKKNGNIKDLLKRNPS